MDDIFKLIDDALSNESSNYKSKMTFTDIFGDIDKTFQKNKPNASEETRVVNEQTGGAKGSKLARMDLIPWNQIWKVAELYGKGAEKYAERNWERGYDWSLSYAAMMRHAVLFWGGEDYDQETGCHHMTSVIFHALALMEFGETHPELDNRPVSQTVDPNVNN